MPLEGMGVSFAGRTPRIGHRTYSPEFWPTSGRARVPATRDVASRRRTWEARMLKVVG